MSSFDLGVNNSVPVTVIATDASGAVVKLPTSFAVSDPAQVLLVDNLDASAKISRVAPFSSGSVTITATVTNPDGTTVTGTLSFSLSAQTGGSGNAVAVEIVPGIAS